MEESISLKSLVSQCVDLAQRAGAHIRAVSDKESEVEGSLGTHDKGLGTGNFDPQTIADRQAQRCIVENLRAVYGMSLRVVGEEGELGVEEGEGKEILIEAPQDDLLDDEWPEDVKLPLCELCVWVDPLDGTKEFTEGRYEYVSTLIGISRLGHPVAGIISEPYSQDKYGQLGRILWGCCQDTSRGVPGVHVFGDPEWRRPQRPKGRCLTLVSRSRASGEVADALQRLSEPGTAPIDGEACKVMPTGPVNEIASSPVELGDAPLITGTQQAGGAGHKVARVVDGAADLWLFPRAGTSRWDSCAAEAMLEACGGALRNRYGERIVYDPDGAMGNTEGVLAAASMGILSATVRVCSTLDVARSLEGRPLSRQWLEMAIRLPSSEVEAFSVMSCQRSDTACTLRLALRYGMDTKDLLPNTLIFKRASEKCKESMFFKTCASRLGLCEGLRLPHVYFNDSRELDTSTSNVISILLMEDVMAEACQKATSLEDLKLSMAAVARMHGKTFQDDDLLSMWEQTNLPASLKPSRSEVLESWEEMIKIAVETPKEAQMFLVEAGIPDLISGLCDVGGTSGGEVKVGRCLIHGDLRRDNIFIDVKTLEVIPINFSYARVDVPTADIAYLLSSSPKFFASFDELLAVYYQTFTNGVDDSKKSLPVVSFNQSVKLCCLELALRPRLMNLDLEEIRAWVKFLKMVLAEMEDV